MLKEQALTKQQLITDLRQNIPTADHSFARHKRARMKEMIAALEYGLILDEHNFLWALMWAYPNRQGYLDLMKHRETLR